MSASNLPDLSHITLPDGSRPFAMPCNGPDPDDDFLYCDKGQTKCDMWGTRHRSKVCPLCHGLGYVPLPPERIHEGMLMDALEKMGYDCIIIVRGPKGYAVEVNTASTMCSSRASTGPTRLAALCEAVLKAAEKGKR